MNRRGKEKEEKRRIRSTASQTQSGIAWPPKKKKRSVELNQDQRSALQHKVEKRELINDKPTLNQRRKVKKAAGGEHPGE